MRTRIRSRRHAVEVVAAALIGLIVVGCGDVNLLATETPAAASRTPVPGTPTAISAGLRSPDPICGEYDDYQSASLAFYSLSAFVQTGLDGAPDGTEGESLTDAVARFERTIRRALAGEVVEPSDSVEALALFWVETDGCMR